MQRKLLNVAATMSLVLSIAIAALWVRSYWRCDRLVCFAASNPFGPFAYDKLSIAVARGSWMLVYQPSAPTGDLQVQYRSEPPSAYAGAHWQGPSLWNRIGFFMRWDADRVVISPLWFVLLLTGLMPAMTLLLRRRAARCHRHGWCATCGYDLRGTPDRCPECGEIPARGRRGRTGSQDPFVRHDRSTSHNC